MLFLTVETLLKTGYYQKHTLGVVLGVWSTRVRRFGSFRNNFFLINFRFLNNINIFNYHHIDILKVSAQSEIFKKL